MKEGAGRVHKVFAQSGEIRSDSMQYPISFSVTSTKINGGQVLSTLDLTETFPNHAQVAFVAVKTPSGRWETRDVSLLESPSADEMPKVQIDYGIVTRVNLFGGEINWLKFGFLRFVKESLVVKDAQDLPLPINELIQPGRTVRFKADTTGPRHRWNAISMTPLSDIFSGRGRVTSVLDGHGWISSPQYGEIYFPFGRFMQPTDPDKRMPAPELLLNAEVDFQICASLPGARGGWRAICVRLPD